MTKEERWLQPISRLFSYTGFTEKSKLSEEKLRKKVTGLQDERVAGNTQMYSYRSYRCHKLCNFSSADLKFSGILEFYRN